MIVGGVLALWLAGALPQDGTPLGLPLEREATPARFGKMPSGDEFANEYPSAAQLLKLGGTVTLACKVSVDGRLEACKVAAENPQGVGFASAAMRLTAYFQLQPAKLDGKAVEGSITFPINFQLPDPAPAEAAPLDPVPVAALLPLARQVVELGGDGPRILRGWDPILERQAATMVADGDPQKGAAALDALRLGLKESVDAEMERRARVMSAKLEEPALKSTVAYLQSPGGRAWVEFEDASTTAFPKDFGRRVSDAARARFCAMTGCKTGEVTERVPAPVR